MLQAPGGGGPGKQKVPQGSRVPFPRFLVVQLAVNALSHCGEFSLPPKKPLWHLFVTLQVLEVILSDFDSVQPFGISFPWSM